MEPSKAKELASLFLTGGGASRKKVTKEQLAETCASLNEDPDYVAYLEEEFGVPAPYLCATFADRAAEYSTMSEATRRRELPELAAHLEVCTDCLDIYRDVYLSAFAAGIQRVQGELKVLGEPIRLVLNWAGNITEFGVGPAALLRLADTSLGAMEALPMAAGETTAEKAWDLLLDEARDLSLHLDIVPGKRARTVEVRFNLTGSGAAAESKMELTYQKEDGTDKGNGPLLRHQTIPLILDCASWLLRLTSTSGTTWEIPLVLNHEN